MEWILIAVMGMMGANSNVAMERFATEADCLMAKDMIKGAGMGLNLVECKEVKPLSIIK